MKLLNRENFQSYFAVSNYITVFPFLILCKMFIKLNKAGKARITVTLWRVHATIVAVEMQ